MDEKEKEEQEHAENQPEQPPGPKTAEVPEFEVYTKRSTISSLDINPKLNSQPKESSRKDINQEP
jgi:hypothetical protein